MGLGEEREREEREREREREREPEREREISFLKTLMFKAKDTIKISFIKGPSLYTR